MLNALSLTGFTTEDEVIALYRTLETIDPPFDLILAVQAKFQTLRGREDLSKNYPRLEVLKQLKRAIEEQNAKRSQAGYRPFKVSLHYYTSSANELAQQIRELIRFTFEPDYLQINVKWPPAEQVAQIASDLPNVNLILQVRQVTAGSVIPKVKAYGGAVHTLLFDKSGGRGKPLDVEKSARLGSALIDAFPDTGLSFAGGLKPENIRGIRDGIDEKLGRHSYSLCMESGIRTKQGGGSFVDPVKVIEILRELNYSVTP